MARLIALALAWHPRMGHCFVVRFSWNAREENPIERVKSIPAGDREYEADGRRWWIAARRIHLLADLFENWQEEIAALAGREPEAFSAVMVGLLRARILAAVQGVLEASPAVSGDDILTALGEAVGRWLDDWRRAVPVAVGGDTDRLAEAHAAAAQTRQALGSWVLRAAFVHGLLVPESPAPWDNPDQQAGD